MKVIGIFGSSAAGKSTLADKLCVKLDANLINMDNYYKNYSEIPFNKRRNLDFADPIHYDVDLLYNHIVQLKCNHSIESPVYSFDLCSRLIKTKTIIPKDVIIIEGYGLLVFEELRSLLDFSFYIDASENVKLNRMIERDVKYRGCSVQDVINKYYNSVLPNYQKFILPYSKYADYTLNGDKRLVELECECLKQLVKNNFIELKGGLIL